MKKFLICLAPAIIGYIVVVIGSASGDTYSGTKGFDDWVDTAVVIHFIGAIITGVVVAKIVYRAMDSDQWLRVLIGIMIFSVVGIAYFSLVVAGGCGLALLTTVVTQSK